MNEKQLKEQVRNYGTDILKRFGLKDLKTLSDEELFYEFSRFGNIDKVKFDGNIFTPKGFIDINECPRQKLIDGLIWAAYLAPQFVMGNYSPQEYTNEWIQSRGKYVGGSSQKPKELIYLSLLEKVKNKISDCIEDYNDVKKIKVDIEKLIHIIDLTFQEEINESYQIEIPLFFQIVNEIMQSFIGGKNLFLELAEIEQTTLFDNDLLKTFTYFINLEDNSIENLGISPVIVDEFKEVDLEGLFENFQKEYNEEDDDFEDDDEDDTNNDEDED